MRRVGWREQVGQKQQGGQSGAWASCGGTCRGSLHSVGRVRPALGRRAAHQSHSRKLPQKHRTRDGALQVLALMAVEASEQLVERNRAIVKANVEAFDAFAAEFPTLVAWERPAAGSTAFPRCGLWPCHALVRPHPGWCTRSARSDGARVRVPAGCW